MMMDHFEDPTGMDWRKSATTPSGSAATTTDSVTSASATPTAAGEAFSDSETGYYSTQPVTITPSTSSFTTNRPRGGLGGTNASYSKTPLFGIPHNRDRGGSLLFTPSQLHQQAQQQAQKSLTNLKQYIVETPFPQPRSSSLFNWGNSSTTSSACSSLSSSLERLDSMRSSPRFGNGTPVCSKPPSPTIIQQSTLEEEAEEEDGEEIKNQDDKHTVSSSKSGGAASGGTLSSPLLASPPRRSSTASTLPGNEPDVEQAGAPDFHESTTSYRSGKAVESGGQTEPEIQGNKNPKPKNTKNSGNSSSNKKRGGSNKMDQQHRGGGNNSGGGPSRTRGSGSGGSGGSASSGSGRFKTAPIPFEDIIQEVDEESEADDQYYFSDSSSVASDSGINPHVLDTNSLSLGDCSTLTRRYSTGDIISALANQQPFKNNNQSTSSNNNNNNNNQHRSPIRLTNQNRGLLGTHRRSSFNGGSSPNCSPLLLNKLPKRKLSHHKSLEMILILPTIPEQSSMASPVNSSLEILE